jgi:tetratricopeptide (TPR) repeat protein
MRRAAILGAILAAAGCSRGGERTADDAALERYALAGDLFEKKRYREAILHYEYVLSVRDRIKDAYLRLAACHEALGSDGEAVAVLERARRVDRTDEAVLRGLGRLHARRGAAREAVRAYRDLLEVRPGDEAVRAEIARLDGLQGSK